MRSVVIWVRRQAGGRLDLALRALAIALFAIQLHGVAVQLPALLTPTALGSDTSNYYAAGLRLNAGHPLYGPLQPGDRLVPPEPGVPAPLLSPPLVAVVWRPLALLPGDLAMTAWWLGGALLISGLVIGFALRGPRTTLLILNGVLLLQVPLAWYLQPPPALPAVIGGWWSPLAIAALSGNLNTYLTGLFVVVWWAESRGRHEASGVVAAVAAALKLGPALLVGWFAAQRGWRSLVAWVIALFACGVVGLVGAGLDANRTFIHLALGGNIAPSALSLPDVLHHLFEVNRALAEHALLLVIPAGLLVIVLLRNHRRAAFAVAIITAIYCSPVVLPGNLALLLAVATPGDARGGASASDLP